MPNQGGSHEQHKAGQQSHKNDGDKRSTERGDVAKKQGDRDQSHQGGGQRGGSGNFANDRERASEAGRKGGQS
jgi:hypothetical protein